MKMNCVVNVMRIDKIKTTLDILRIRIVVMVKIVQTIGIHSTTVIISEMERASTVEVVNMQTRVEDMVATKMPVTRVEATVVNIVRIELETSTLTTMVAQEDTGQATIVVGEARNAPKDCTDRSRILELSRLFSISLEKSSRNCSVVLRSS